MTKQIQTKKFICEDPISFGKFTAIGKLNFTEEHNIRLCVNDNAFSELRKAIYKGVNIIITTYNTDSKCLGDLVEEYYEREHGLDYFIIIDEAHILL